MVLFNYSTRELTAKIVYYGPGICGKTTNLQFIHENLPGAVRGKMLSLATKTDRTLFFDFLPIDLGEIRGMKTRVQLYTVPGQVFYNETRKLVLKGVDGIVFVADSQETMAGANVESFRNLEDNLKAHGIKLADIPHVIQFNKRDLPKLSSIEDLNSSVNKHNAPFYESVATTGIGVQDTLKAIVKLVLLNLTKKYESKSAAEAAVAAASAPPARPAAAAPAPPAARAASPAPPAAAASTPSGGGKKKGKDKHKKAPTPPPPAPVMSPFADSEIDSLVGEVGDVQEMPMPAAAAASVEEGAWMGVKEGTESGSFADDSATYGSSVPLDDLLAAADAKSAQPTAKTPGGEFEVDRGFDPEWPQPTPSAPMSEAPAAASVASPAPIATMAMPAVAQETTDVRLTQVATDDELFSDPSLEIAHLVVGQTREIMVPVMLGEGATAGRFKLAIRLRLEPVE